MFVDYTLTLLSRLDVAIRDAAAAASHFLPFLVLVSGLENARSNPLPPPPANKDVRPQVAMHHLVLLKPAPFLLSVGTGSMLHWLLGTYHVCPVAEENEGCRNDRDNDPVDRLNGREHGGACAGAVRASGMWLL